MSEVPQNESVSHRTAPRDRRAGCPGAVVPQVKGAAPMSVKAKSRIVYVVGAGLSAGLGFPTIGNLLSGIWPRLEAAGLADELADVIRFHHPAFNPALHDTFPNIEELLSEMQANSQLFDSSRPATGGFTSQSLDERRQGLLLELAKWFHEIQAKALSDPPVWLSQLAETIRAEKARSCLG